MAAARDGQWISEEASTVEISRVFTLLNSIPYSKLGGSFLPGSLHKCKGLLACRSRLFGLNLGYLASTKVAEKTGDLLAEQPSAGLSLAGIWDRVQTA